MYSFQCVLSARGIRDRSVCIVTDYGMDGRGSIAGRGKKFIWTPQTSLWLWDSPRLLSNGYQELFPRGLSGQRNVKLTIYLHPMPKSRMVELYLHSPLSEKKDNFNASLTLSERYGAWRVLQPDSRRWFSRFGAEQGVKYYFTVMKQHVAKCHKLY
jgi:hypothetical protein